MKDNVVIRIHWNDAIKLDMLPVPNTENITSILLKKEMLSKQFNAKHFIINMHS